MAATTRVTLVLADDPRKPYRQGQERRLRGVGRVSIISVEKITLADVDRARARALGHTEPRGQSNAVDLFQRAWIAEHDEKWLGRAPEGYERGESAQRARFEQRWSWKDASLVHYTMAEEVRFLAAGRGQIDEDENSANYGNGDYTPSASRSIDRDAECVDEATQNAYARKAEPVGEKMRGKRLQTFAQDLAEAHAQKEAERRPMHRAA